MKKKSLSFLLCFILFNLVLSASESRYKGFYLGGNVGYGQDYIEVRSLEIDAIDIPFVNRWQNKVRLDIQIGYDWRYCDKVVGLVLDTESLRVRGGTEYGKHLLFATTGLAFNNLSCTINDGSLLFGKNINQTRLGWIVGVGTESPLWRNFTIGTNLFYTYIPEKNTNGTMGSGSHYSFKSSVSRWSAEFSINYRFGPLRFCR